jgi:hypothetical protein
MANSSLTPFNWLEKQAQDASQKPSSKRDPLWSSTSFFTQTIEPLKLIDLQGIIKNNDSDKYYKTFNTDAHLKVMVYSQLAGFDSLRDVENGMQFFRGEAQHFGLTDPPRRSTIAYANEHRTYKVFEDVFNGLVPIVQKACRASPHYQPPFDLNLTNVKLNVDVNADGDEDSPPCIKPMLVAIDSTTIDLCQSLYDWAFYKRQKGGIKVHTMIDTFSGVPIWAHVTVAKVHDQKPLELLDPVTGLVPGSMVAVDRAYNDYAMLYAWDQHDIFFVCRAKDNMRYDILESHDVPEADGKFMDGEPPRSYVISDQTFELANPRSKDLYPEPMRLIRYWCEEPKGSTRNSREMRFFTNNFVLPAATIAACYKRRWSIEAFFKLLKQNLRIKSFLGTSANAVKIQIYSSLIAILLTKYIQANLKAKWCFSNLLNSLRSALYQHRYLIGWYNQSYRPSVEAKRTPDDKPPGKTGNLSPEPRLF